MPEIIVPLILLMIVGALVAIQTPNLLYSVVSVGAVGFLLSIVFLFLSAPDLAITQIVVEVITLVLLLRATIRPEVKAVSGYHNLFGTLLALAMVVSLAIFSVYVFADFPAAGQAVKGPSSTYLQEGLEKTGAANIVTAVLLDFRAYDTLGEAAVLFCAVMGALAILRRKARKQPEEVDEEEET
jgi:multicomponent Na+:H+ antiporter subunit B